MQCIQSTGAGCCIWAHCCPAQTGGGWGLLLADNIRFRSSCGHTAASRSRVWFLIWIVGTICHLGLGKECQENLSSNIFLLNNIHKYLVKSQSYTIGPAPAALQTQKRGIFENLPRNVNADLCWLIKMKMCGLGLIIKLNARVAGPLCGAARWCAMWARPL